MKITPYNLHKAPLLLTMTPVSKQPKSNPGINWSLTVYPIKRVKDLLLPLPSLFLSVIPAGNLLLTCTPH